MKDQDDYSAVVTQAEKAVASVKDPELRRIAFQRVLDELLSSSGSKGSNARIAKRSRQSQNASANVASKGGPKTYIEELIQEGFFKKPKPISEVRTALANQGHHIPVTSLSGPLQTLCQQKRLRRQKGTESGTYTYSEW